MRLLSAKLLKSVSALRFSNYNRFLTHLASKVITVSINLHHQSYTSTQFSKRGRIVPELHNLHTRELLVREYRLIYKI
jgi:hypothetical protein